MRASYPIQVNSKDLPDDGIALIIATDEDPVMRAIGHAEPLEPNVNVGSTKQGHPAELVERQALATHQATDCAGADR
jgi:hypothetical protein